MTTKIPSGILTFASGPHLKVYNAFKDYYNHYRNINDQTAKGKNLQFTTVDETGKEMTFAQKEAEMNVLLRNEVVRVSGMPIPEGISFEQWAANPSVSWATFAIVSALVDMILPDAMIESYGMYTDVRVGGWGDSFSFDVQSRDLFAVSKNGKGKRTSEIRMQYRGQVVVLPEMRMLTVGVALHRVLAGLDSLAELVMKAVRSMEVAMTIDVYNAFNTAMGNLSTTAVTGLKVTGYTQDDLVRLAQSVTAFNGGAKAIILGTQRALSSVLPADANYRYDLTSSPYVTIGYIPTAFGYDVMALPQVADWSNPYDTVLDDNRIYIVSPGAGKIVKLVLEGSTLTNTADTYKNANLLQTTTLYKSWGTGIATSAIGAVIDLT